MTSSFLRRASSFFSLCARYASFASLRSSFFTLYSACSRSLSCSFFFSALIACLIFLCSADEIRHGRDKTACLNAAVSAQACASSLVVLTTEMRCKSSCFRPLNSEIRHLALTTVPMSRASPSTTTSKMPRRLTMFRFLIFVSEDVSTGFCSTGGNRTIFSSMVAPLPSSMVRAVYLRLMSSMATTTPTMRT